MVVDEGVDCVVAGVVAFGVGFVAAFGAGGVVEAGGGGGGLVEAGGGGGLGGEVFFLAPDLTAAGEGSGDGAAATAGTPRNAAAKNAASTVRVVRPMRHSLGRS